MSSRRRLSRNRAAGCAGAARSLATRVDVRARSPSCNDAVVKGSTPRMPSAQSLPAPSRQCSKPDALFLESTVARLKAGPKSRMFTLLRLHNGLLAARPKACKQRRSRQLAVCPRPKALAGGSGQAAVTSQSSWSGKDHSILTLLRAVADVVIIWTREDSSRDGTHAISICA